jgi:antibiotic biosynthesis monooxygenase (ABM) superfamily enzyme
MTAESPQGSASGRRSGVLKDFLVFLGLVLVGLVIAALALPVLGFVLAVAVALAKLLVVALLVYLIVYWVSPQTAAKWREAIRRAFQ